MALSVKLNVFEGPLDLLLHLIDKNKIDIYDIPIVEITDQYMEYLHSMEKEDLGIMSEFLVMAATLLDIKCKMLLPEEVLQYTPPSDPQELLRGLTLERMSAIYQALIRRQENKIDPIRSKFGRIEKEEISLSDKLLEMKEYAKTHRKFSFRRLMENQHSKIQLIVTFLAILELMKMGHVHAEQEDLFDDIHVEVITDPDTWKNLTEFADE